MIQDMHEGATKIRRIVEDLKDFARRDDRGSFDRVDLNAVARASVRLVENSIRTATERFEASYAADLPPITGNAQRIEQVVVNLILNACQALPSMDRAITLATSFDRAAGDVKLTVHDEGRGIAPEHLPHLTDPFFTTKRESGGTGLGLSVSAGIIKEHGGSLSFHSEPGRGATVTLALPALKEETAR
jgi:polar amino acid transport system substrate-binding protein